LYFVLKLVYTAAPHCQFTVRPDVLLEKVACQITSFIPPGRPLAGTAKVRPANKSLPARPDEGSSVFQPNGLPISWDSLVNSVVARVIELENVIWESGTVS
jgi:hypothetical protein